MEKSRSDRVGARAGLVAAVSVALQALVKFLVAFVLGALLVILRVLPVALRLACVGAEVYAAYVTFQRVCAVYGADVTGVMLAMLVIICPLVFVLSSGLSWGGLAMVAGVTYAAGLAAPMLSPVARALVITGALGAVVIHFIGGQANEQESG